MSTILLFTPQILEQVLISVIHTRLYTYFNFTSKRLLVPTTKFTSNNHDWIVIAAYHMQHSIQCYYCNAKVKKEEYICQKIDEGVSYEDATIDNTGRPPARYLIIYLISTSTQENYFPLCKIPPKWHFRFWWRGGGNFEKMCFI